MGRTAIAIGISIASGKSIKSEIITKWGTHEEAIAWQKLQKKPWSTVKWLLKESSKNLRTRLEVTDELLEALAFDAPPQVISLLLEASSDKIASDTAFAWKALYSCIMGNYPIDTLKSIAVRSPDEVTIQRDENGTGLVGLQFAMGCFDVDTVQEWKVREDRITVLEQWLENDSAKRCGTMN